MNTPCKCDAFWAPSEWPCRFAPAGTTALCGNTQRKPVAPKAEENVLDYYSWAMGRTREDTDGYN